MFIQARNENLDTSYVLRNLQKSITKDNRTFFKKKPFFSAVNVVKITIYYTIACLWWSWIYLCCLLGIIDQVALPDHLAAELRFTLF